MNLEDINHEQEIYLGEDSTRQFKVLVNNAAKLADEMCAFSNSNGGVIYVGVRDNGDIAGLSPEDIRHLNGLISAAANEQMKPPVYPQTKTVQIKEKLVTLIYITEGANKPYMTSSGVYWVKCGSDKRKASPQELLRMFQQSQSIYMDGTLTSAVLNDENYAETIDLAKFYNFFEKSRGHSFKTLDISPYKAFENMNLAKEGRLNFAGLLLFGSNPQNIKPFCLIRCISYYETSISDDHFIDKRDCIGTLDEQFRSAMIFLKNHLSRKQDEGSFNQEGKLEIDEKALEESIVNALLHRDYSKNAVIRLFIFKDRVEIISPGSLPNHLTIENIINGNSIIRNPILVSFATKILPYSGIGSGVPRILKHHPNTQLQDDRDGEQFTITLFRNNSGF